MRGKQGKGRKKSQTTVPYTLKNCRRLSLRPNQSSTIAAIVPRVCECNILYVTFSPFSFYPYKVRWMNFSCIHVPFMDTMSTIAILQQQQYNHDPPWSEKSRNSGTAERQYIQPQHKPHPIYPLTQKETAQRHCDEMISETKTYSTISIIINCKPYDLIVRNGDVCVATKWTCRVIWDTMKKSLPGTNGGGKKIK